MKTILCYLLLLFSLKAYAQNEEFKEHYAEYKKALINKDYNKALENIDVCINYLENKEIKDTLYLNLIINKADIFHVQNDYYKAIEFLEKAVELEINILGKDHQNFAFDLSNLAYLYTQLGQYEKAKALHEQALELYRVIYGTDNLYLAIACNKLADIYTQLGEYNKAHPLYEETLKIRKKILGQDHADVAKSLNNLALSYSNLGQYEKSQQLYGEALKILKKELGEEHPDVATGLNNLAGIYKELGQYDKAQTLYEQAVKIRIAIQGDMHPDIAATFNNLAGLCRRMGQFEKAISFYGKTLNILISFYGKEHPDVLTTLNNLAVTYSDMGQYNKATPIYEELLKIRKKVLGNEHPDVANSLYNLALNYSELAEYDKALLLIEESLIISKKTFGEEHPDVAQSLNSLGVIYSKVGQYEKAQFHYVKAIQITRKIFGEVHPEFGLIIENLAQLYFETGHYKSAKPLFEQALEINRKALGEKHPAFATSLTNLGSLYSKLGQYEKAQQLFEKSLKITRDLFGEEHPDVGNSLRNLGLLYLKLGEYEKARQLLEQSLKIIRNLFGEEHPDVATSLSNLAGLYSEMGQYEMAKALNTQALFISERIFDEEHIEVATILNNLSSNFFELGQYEKAQQLLEQALKIRSTILGVKHPDVALTMNNLAELYSRLGLHEKSKPLYDNSLNIFKEAFGEEHPYVAMSLNNLAGHFARLKQYEKARTLYEQALIIYKKSQGEEHLDVANNLNNLNLLYFKMGNYEKAAFSSKKSLEISNKHLKRTLPSLSDIGKNALVKKIGYEYEFYDGLFIHKKLKYASVIFSLNNNLFLNNLTLRSNEAMRKSILTSRDTLLIDEFENWLALKKQYANAQSLSLDELKNNGINLKAMEDSIEIKERLLSQRSQAFQTEQQKLELNYETLKSNLKAEEATVMFHSFNYYNGKDWTDSTLYTAYIIRKDQKQPEMVYLFEQAALDSLLPAPDTRSMMNNLYQTGDSTLYNLVWKPLEPYLKGVKTAYVAPSGLLHKIAFAALPLPDGSRLSDRYQLRQVLSGHDVVFKEEPAVFNNVSTTSVALLGGINYEYLPESKDTVYFSPLSLLPESTDRGTAFGYLPGTESEVSSIEQLLKNDKVNVTLLKGNNATEEQFKTLQGDKAPKVLHIATHGFFAPDPKRDLNKENSMRLMGQENRYTAADNPLYRSGLLLAGGNNSWTKKTTLPADQDGVLTAYEVANMDLSNTQLVVLSACETALGDVKGREGVFGLQRGFRLAGAKYMLMSLWRIPDKETAEYMTKFYSELAKSNNIVTAYQTTQTNMKTTYPNEPQIWAGMVLVE